METVREAVQTTIDEMKVDCMAVIAEVRAAPQCTTESIEVDLDRGITHRSWVVSLECV